VEVGDLAGVCVAISSSGDGRLTDILVGGVSAQSMSANGSWAVFKNASISNIDRRAASVCKRSSTVYVTRSYCITRYGTPTCAVYYEEGRPMNSRIALPLTWYAGRILIRRPQRSMTRMCDRDLSRKIRSSHFPFAYKAKEFCGCWRCAFNTYKALVVTL
jgi:hypothetical protein